MLFISDEISFSWDLTTTISGGEGTLFAARLDGAGERVEIDTVAFAILDAVVRLRAAERQTVSTAVAADGHQAVGATLDRLLASGVLHDGSDVPGRDDYYMPMLYFRMLIDPLKTQSYMRALERAVKPGMKVLDVGAGLGIFSVKAAQLGAKVWAVESRPILATAQAMARDNGVADAIEFIRGDLFDPAVAAQVGTVDLIISEFIGDEIFDEEILVKTIWMRDLYLRGKAGQLIPSALEAFAVPFESDLAVNRHGAKLQQVASTGRQHGLAVDAIDALMHREGLRCDFSDRLYVGAFSEVDMEAIRLLGPPTRFHHADLAAADYALFRSRIQIPVERAGRVDGVLLYFTAHLDEAVQLTSAPWLARTHWPQIIYLRDGERRVAAGDTIEVAAAYVGGRGFCLSIH